MGVFRRKVPSHYILIHPDNITKNDWIIVLEAGTIIGPSTERLRVARATLDKKVVKKYNIFLRVKHYLVLEGYDPRIHALYFCPQLYKFNSDSKLVALEGEEIGQIVAQAVQGGVVERRPWYEPSDKLPNEPVITATMQTEFDTVVAGESTARNSSAAGSSRPVPATQH